jgi:Asp-tRNA(Asn)/Glu-tRNA(Gln) amidotransferase A subunit family amidase
LNHPITDLGIPPDSQRRETALAASGLPVGIQIIGPPGSDTLVIAVAEAIENALQAA